MSYSKGAGNRLAAELPTNWKLIAMSRAAADSGMKYHEFMEKIEKDPIAHERVLSDFKTAFLQEKQAELERIKVHAAQQKKASSPAVEPLDTFSEQGGLWDEI